ncbi:MAG TPA: hypothetical protein PLD98_08715, partial [Clostridiales bacterium]|nr:hypothetical protein [Clostridiales bacterium]
MGKEGVNSIAKIDNLEKKDIKSYDLVELKALMGEIGQPAFRAGQVFRWLHKECVQSFEEMTNLPLNLRQQLNDNFVIIGAAIEKKL